MGILLVGSSRRPLIELERQIVSTAMLVGGVGILVAILASLWFAARVTRPVVSLAEAARRVAAGDLNAKVDVESSDELGELAASFNRMTEDLVQQKDRTLHSRRWSCTFGLRHRLGPDPGGMRTPVHPLLHDQAAWHWGLALAIVQSVVSDHGGKISVESATKRREPRFASNCRANLGRGRAARLKRSKTVAQRAHLLIVDDEANPLPRCRGRFVWKAHEATVGDNANEGSGTVEVAVLRPHTLRRGHAR